MDGGWVDQIPVKYIYDVAGALALMVSAGIGVMSNMAVKAFKKGRKDLADIKTELEIQRSNHLKHIQEATEQMRDEQKATNKELNVQSGYLSAIADSVKKA